MKTPRNRPAGGRGRLLLITGCRPVSAVLFHGFGLPPWYDLPALQRQPRYRNAMTAQVNRAAQAARAAGFTAVDVHEAFPVNVMAADPDLRILRGADRFLFERRYAGFALLAPPFPAGRVQPRLGLLRAMRWNGRPVDELDILTAHLAAHGVPPVYAEAAKPYFRGTPGGAAARRFDRAAFRDAVRFPGRLSLVFDAAVPMRRLDGFPGVERAAGGRLDARARDADALMDLYRFAGMLLQQARRY